MKTIAAAFVALLIIGAGAVWYAGVQPVPPSIERDSAVDVVVDDNRTEIIGEVVRVLDGDTIQVQPDEGEAVTVRLNGIDCPEKKQRFGPEATELVRTLTEGQQVSVRSSGLERYGRTLGDVYLGPIWINGQLVSDGLAWHYVKYSDDVTLATLQQQARAERRGLWADAKLIAPWDYRNGQRIPSALPAELESIRDSDETVWITPSGEKYHRADCRFVGDTAKEIPLSRAGAYEPCGVCKP